MSLEIRGTIPICRGSCKFPWKPYHRHHTTLFFLDSAVVLFWNSSSQSSLGCGTIFTFLPFQNLNGFRKNDLWPPWCVSSLTTSVHMRRSSRCSRPKHLKQQRRQAVKTSEADRQNVLSNSPNMVLKNQSVTGLRRDTTAGTLWSPGQVKVLNGSSWLAARRLTSNNLFGADIVDLDLFRLWI